MSKKKPFDDLLDLLEQMPSNAPSEADIESGSIGSSPNSSSNISELLRWLLLWQQSSTPKLNETHICILVSSYEECDQLIDLKEFINNAGKGKVPVSKLCKDRGVGLRVLEMAPEIPHIVSEKWSENHCMAAVGFGMEATAAGGEILGLAALAPGDEKYCSTFCHSLIKNLQKNDKTPENLNKNNALAVDVLHSMKNTTGREVAAMLGAMIAARSRNMPVVGEGWPGIAALCALTAIDPTSADHVRVASVESNDQATVIDALGLSPVIGSFVDLGPGCGVALAHSTIASLANLTK